jgi:hypothetical protein
MAWTLRTMGSGIRYGLQSALRFGLWLVPRSRLSGSPSIDASAQTSGVNAPGGCAAPEKRFYSLMIEVRPAEADAETLRLFSDVGSLALTETLNLPDGCELRRCMIVSADFAEMLIRM